MSNCNQLEAVPWLPDETCKEWKHNTQFDTAPDFKISDKAIKTSMLTILMDSICNGSNIAVHI